MRAMRSTLCVLLSSTCVFIVVMLSILSRRHVKYRPKALPLNDSFCHNYEPGYRQGDHVKPLLTLFTSWPSESKKADVWNATLKNWAQFKPFVRPVFFSVNESQRQEIAKYGWDVLPVRQMGTSDLPVLKIMFMDAICIFDSVFYGYSNGDILYDNSLLETLRAVQKRGSKTSLLVSGIRTNVGNLTKGDTDIRKLADVAKRKGKLFIPLSQDYFITDKGYPWRDIPDLVIGRAAYDNWLLLFSRQRKLLVVDATETLLAFHQSTSGNHDGWHHEDSTYNIDLLTTHYWYVRYDGGATFCASLRTTGNSTYGISVVERKELDKSCFPL